MTDQNDQGTFSCRIDGRAGYLRLYNDRVDLVRSGRRGSRAFGPESIALNTITRVSTGKAGRLLTTVEIYASGSRTELKLPSIDAESVKDLLASLVRQSSPVTPVAASSAAPTIFSTGPLSQIAAAQAAAAPPPAPLDSSPELPAAPLALARPEKVQAPVPNVSADIVSASAVVEMPAQRPTLRPTLRPEPAPEPIPAPAPRPIPAAGRTVPAQPLSPDLEQRIERLEVLHFAGILSDSEFEVRRSEILAEA